MTTENVLSKEWSKFDPAVGYVKAMQNVKLKNGDIIWGCWPNAGVWNVMYKKNNPDYYGKEIPVELTYEVQLHESEIIL